MKAVVTNWGNSLAFRIPSSVVKALGLLKGSRVKINVENERIIIEKVEEEDFFSVISKGGPSLKELANKVTRKNMHDFSEFDSKPVGKEVW